MFTIINHYQFTRFSTKMNPLIYYPPFCPITTRSTLSSFLHHRIQESLCPHQGPTHPPRSRTAWRPALPSCGGDCLCPVPAAAPLRTAHPFPEYTRPRFLWMECCCRFFSVREPHRQHKRQKYTNGYGCNDPSFHNPPPILFFPYSLFIWELSVLRCHFSSLPEIILRLYIK